MDVKVSDLTVDQLKELISVIVQEKIEDAIEEFKSLNDKEYLNSISEARKEYKTEKFTSLDDLKWFLSKCSEHF